MRKLTFCEYFMAFIGLIYLTKAIHDLAFT